MVSPAYPLNRVRRLVLSLTAPAWMILLGTFPGVVFSETVAASRIVSLNPSLTQILLSLDAGKSLVGVDDYSATHLADVAERPRVGGLYSPSLESVVALEPDVVVLVPSAEQRDFQGRLEQMGIRVEAFENIRFEDVLENIRRLGVLTDRVPQANQRVEAVQRARAAARRVLEGQRPLRVLVVLQRDPVFVVGGGSFIDEMLEAVGAENVAGDFDDPYPRVGVEWVVGKSPEVLLDLSPDPDGALSYWSRWPSIQAVSNQRVVTLDSALISMPGPDLDRAIQRLAGVLHGPPVAAAIAREGQR
ncbi:MAG: helical backbone metal receptor [Myxococcota bacterium]|nr:helical backbone metal receptor [Myxococcota bacterium]